MSIIRRSEIKPVLDIILARDGSMNKKIEFAAAVLAVIEQIAINDINGNNDEKDWIHKVSSDFLQEYRDIEEERAQTANIRGKGE